MSGLRAGGSSRIALAAAALVAWVAVAIAAIALFGSQVGFDFYQFWGVALAHGQMPGRAPYASADGYAAVLNAMSDASTDPRLHFMNGMRRSLQPLGTPIFYAAFDPFARDYSLAFATFVALQHAAVALAIVLLARLRGMGMAAALLAAAVVELAFNPFAQDVKVGNVNALQLLAMAALVFACARRPGHAPAVFDAALGAAVAALVAFKPNTPWIALAFAAHIAAVRGMRGVAAAAAGGAAAAIALFVAGIAFFGDRHAWGDWLVYVRRLEGGGTLSEGNISLSTLVAHGSRTLGMGGAIALIVALFGALVLAAASAMGARRDRLGEVLRGVARDPGLVVSWAIVLTFATYPLVWPHYHVWAVLPIMLLFPRVPRWDPATVAIVTSCVAFSKPALQALAAVDAVEATALAVVFAWLGLVPALLAAVARKRRESDEPGLAPAGSAGP